MRAASRPAWQGRSASGVRLLRRASLTATAVGVVATLVAFPMLPASVPTHFGIAGEADAWGPSWTILVLAALWAALQALIAWVSTHPEWGNVPVAITEANAQAVYREIERTLVLLGVALVVVFASILLSVAGVDGTVGIWVGLAGVLAATGVGIARILTAA